MPDMTFLIQTLVSGIGTGCIYGLIGIGFCVIYNASGIVNFAQGMFVMLGGMLTHALAIEHYRQRAMREYDFLAGDARYKRSLANSSRDLHWTVVYGDRLWARAFLLGRRVWSRLADKKPAAERI